MKDNIYESAKTTGLNEEEVTKIEPASLYKLGARYGTISPKDF